MTVNSFDLGEVVYMSILVSSEVQATKRLKHRKIEDLRIRKLEDMKLKEWGNDKRNAIYRVDEENLVSFILFSVSLSKQVVFFLAYAYF